MAVYSARQSSYSDGDTITAAHTNDEFNAILATFHVSTGHTHDGTTAGDGGPLSTLYSNAISFGTGADTDIVLTFNANTSDGVITWMEDEDFFKFSDAITVGVDDTGYDVKFFGATSGSYFLWDESADSLLLTDSTPLKIGDAQDLTLYHDGSNSYITNAVGALKIATETSGIAVTIGHTTSEVTVADNLTVTGTLTLGSGAELTEAELELLDGITAGTVAASKAVVVDSNKDIGTFRNVTIDGTFSDGNYTFDTSGNVSGLGTIGSGAITSSSTVQGTTITATTAFVPDASDGAALGTSSLEFSDLFLADGAVVNFGDDQDVSLTHVADTGLLLSSTDQLQFGDSGTYIYQSADGVLDLVSDTEIEINATTIDINGNVEISGDLTVSGDDITMGTNTSGAALIADGTNFNPVVISGDIAIATDGTASIGSGVIVNADVNASAAIADSKLATISTADKVSAAAIQVDGATDGTGITIVDGDKLIVDDAGATKYVEASQLKTYAAGSSASAGFALAMAVAL